MKCNPILLSCYVGMLLGFTDAAATPQNAVTQGGVNNLISKYAAVEFDDNGGNYFPELDTCISTCRQQPACTHVVLLHFNVAIGDQGCATTGFTLNIIDEPTDGENEEQLMQVNEWYKVYQVEEGSNEQTVYQVEEAFSMDTQNEYTQNGCMDLAIGDSPYKASKKVDCGDACNMNCETEVKLQYSYSGGSLRTKQFQIVNDRNGYVTATRTDSFGWTVPLTIQCCGSLPPSVGMSSVEPQTFVPTCGKPVFRSANRYLCGFSRVYNDNAATWTNPSDAVCCVNPTCTGVSGGQCHLEAACVETDRCECKNENQNYGMYNGDGTLGGTGCIENAKCDSLVESACGFGRVKNLATADKFCYSNPCESYDQHCCKDDVSERCGTCEALNRHGCLQGSTDCGGCKSGYTGNALSVCEETKVVRTHTATLNIDSEMSSEDQEQGRNEFKRIVAFVENVVSDEVVVTSTESIVRQGSVTIASYIFEGETTTSVRDTYDVDEIEKRITSEFENTQFFKKFKGMAAHFKVAVVESDPCSQRVLDVCADLGRFGCYPGTNQCGECMHGSRLEGGKCKSVPILTRNDTSALQAVMMLAGIIIGIAGAVAFIYRSSILSWFRTATQDKGRRVGQVAISSNIHSNPLNLISRAREFEDQVADTSYQPKPST